MPYPWTLEDPMPLIRRITLAVAGVAAAGAFSFGMLSAHAAKPNHVYDGMSPVHSQIYGDTIKAPSHVYDG
jgi:hypothetical protein